MSTVPILAKRDQEDETGIFNLAIDLKASEKGIEYRSINPEAPKAVTFPSFLPRRHQGSNRPERMIDRPARTKIP
jgi:hypothetical protein